jgi:hypothetical protein
LAEVGEPQLAVDCGFHPLIGAIPTPQSIERLFSKQHGRSDLFAQAISAL